MKFLIKIFLFSIYIKFILSSVELIDGDFWFPFPTVFMNYSNNSVIDMSYLNWKIGKDKIKIKDGHFYHKDKQVRFFGTNVAYAAGFPEKEDAPNIAKRMAQLGINVVRFHHMDTRDIWGNNQDNNKNSIIDETQLDKLHYFLFCLKENGIYANINLHVSRNYPEIMDEKEILNAFSYGKSLDRYYPQFIKDQLKYAEDLLGSFNKYTGYKVGDDPMILTVELNNENTMFNLENEDKVKTLTDKLKNELVKQWRDYLKNKYKKFEDINKIYNNETIDLDNDLVENNKITCQNSNSKCTFEDKLVKFDVTEEPPNTWSNQIHFGYIEISNYTTYTIEFDAKVEKETDQTLTFEFQENLSPYRSYLRIRNIKLKTKFEHYTLSGKTEFDCQFSEESKAIPKIVLPPAINHYEVKNVKLYKGKGDTNFTEDGDEDIDKILYPTNNLIQNLPNMAYDLRTFFMFTETNTQKLITNYIKQNLSFPDLLILDSQISYGSFFTYEREHDNSDIIDIHGYWEHPQFEAGHSWDMKYYSIKNTPMIKSKTFGTFNTISKGKCYNKPFTISEYNHPFPNEHLHEKFPMFGSWSAFHDYDAIYQFSYDQTKNEEYISGYFKMSSNPIDFAMSPYLALAFRKNYVQKSKNYVRVKLTKGYIAEKMKDKNYNINDFLVNQFHAGWNAVYEVQIIDDNKVVEPDIQTNINIEEKGYFINDQIKWNNTDEGNEAYYYVITDKYITLTGFLGDSEMSKDNNLGDLINIKVKLNENLNDTCTIGLVSLDDKKLEDSEKLLLTIVGKVRNTDQKWNEQRTTTSSGWGVAPTLVQFIEFEAILKFKEEEKPQVFSINRFGEKDKELTLTGNSTEWILKSDDEKPSLNYYIIRKLANSETKEKEESKGKKNYTKIIIIIAIALVILIIITGLIICCVKRSKNQINVDSVDKNLLDDKDD